MWNFVFMTINSLTITTYFMYILSKDLYFNVFYVIVIYIE